MSEDALVNTGASPPAQAGWGRVLGIQTKLHGWAAADPGRRFDDLFNLVTDPAFLAAAWDRVRENKGSRTAGVDWQTAQTITDSGPGVEGFLAELRADLKSGVFRPVPVRQVRIPKSGGKLRALGIPTVRDRVVQAALKLVLEPIFEADFHPCSYGFRPNRRAQDAIEEIRHFAKSGYIHVFEGDIAACFDEISHPALMERVRHRITDKRVLQLVKAFLKAGLLDEQGINRDTHTGTPQGGILSPLLANVALSVLDEHFAVQWNGPGARNARDRHRRRGGAIYRLIRYADDFVVMVRGRWEQAEGLWDEVSQVLARVGLRLAVDKTKTVHIDEGLDFLGFRIQRHRQRGSDRQLIYSYPSKKSMQAIRRKVKQATGERFIGMTKDDLFRRLGQITRGWALYFRHGASAAAFQDLQHHLWRRVWHWTRRKHPKTPRRQLYRQLQPPGTWWPVADTVELFRPGTMKIIRYRYRGTKIPTPWAPQPDPAIT
jgi:RNA-directed DNA polymerase